MKNPGIRAAAIFFAVVLLSSCALVSNRHERALETLTPIPDASNDELIRTLESILREFDAREAVRIGEAEALFGGAFEVAP